MMANASKKFPQRNMPLSIAEWVKGTAEAALQL
jgi:hypothetical protein